MFTAFLFACYLENVSLTNSSSIMRLFCVIEYCNKFTVQRFLHYFIWSYVLVVIIHTFTITRINVFLIMLFCCNKFEIVNSIILFIVVFVVYMELMAFRYFSNKRLINKPM